MDTFEQLQVAERMTRLLVAELRAGGCHPVSIAATLCAAAGALYREGLEEEHLREVIQHMAECMVTGQPQ